MKKIIIFIIALLMSLTGCNSGVVEDNNNNAEKETATVLSNTYYRLTVDKELNVAYLGGSITQGSGATEYSKNWVALTTKWLSDNFPEATINENNAGLSNTGSNYGIFRLEEDIINIAVPDLIFIEYTSNDWGRFGDLNISRQNESIMRKLYEVNPKIDIVFLFTGFSYDSPCRRASTALAKHYGLPIVDPGSELKRRIDEEEGGDYAKYSSDKIHPNNLGHAYYVELIGELLGKHLIDEAPDEAKYLDANIPEPLNKDGLFMSPRMIDPLLYDIPEDFKYTEAPLICAKLSTITLSKPTRRVPNTNSHSRAQASDFSFTSPRRFPISPTRLTAASISTTQSEICTITTTVRCTFWSTPLRRVSIPSESRTYPPTTARPSDFSRFV